MDNTFDPENKRELFLASCRIGLAPEAIQEITTSERVTRTMYRTGFTEACIHGKLLVAQWLLTLCTFSYWQTLIGEMISGNMSNLETIKWVYEQSLQRNEHVDLQFNDNEYFFISLCNGAIRIANWLYEIAETTENKIDLCTSEHLYFQMCIYKNLPDMLKWLSSKLPRMHNLSICDNVLIKQIRTIRNYDMLYAIIEITGIDGSGLFYDLARVAVKRNDFRLFSWILRSKIHIYIDEDQHFIIRYCIFNKMYDFVKEIVSQYSIYYALTISPETGEKNLSPLNPYIECMNRKLYDKAIQILRLQQCHGSKSIDCGICMKQALDVPDESSSPYVVTTACKHSFCLPCFVTWTENPISQHRCAMCRSEVRYNDVSYFENDPIDDEMMEV